MAEALLGRVDTGMETPERTVSKQLFILAGRTNHHLAEETAGYLEIGLTDAGLSRFPSGEIHCELAANIRGGDVFIMQGHSNEAGVQSLNDSIIEQLIMIDAAKRASAKRITAVCPILGYARQDRKVQGREAIMAKMMPDLFKTAGADRMLSIDLHSPQTQGCFDGPFDHVSAWPVLQKYVRDTLFKTAKDELVMVAPDAGSLAVTQKHAAALDLDFAAIHKNHREGGSKALEVLGEVAGRSCLLPDDMIDSAGTLRSAALLLEARGATEVFVMASHAILSSPARERLETADIIKEVIVTNTLPIAHEKLMDKLRILSAAPVIAQSIQLIFEDRSLSEHMEVLHAA